MDRDENPVGQIVVLEQLATVLKPVAAEAWLFTPNPLLDRDWPGQPVVLPTVLPTSWACS